MRIKKQGLALVFSAITCTSVMASDYVGAGVGTVFPDIPEFGSASGVELIAGIASQVHAVEISYIDFGSSHSGGVTASATGFTVSLLALMSLDENDELFLKIGAMNWDANESGSINVERGDTDIFFGIGLNGKLENELSISLRYNKYNVDEFDPSMLSVNFLIGF